MVLLITPGFMKSFLRRLFGLKTAADIGAEVPANLKFGVLVAIALFWADFLKVLFSDLVQAVFGDKSPLIATFLIAAVATVVGILVLEGYRQIRSFLEKVRVE